MAEEKLHTYSVDPLQIKEEPEPHHIKEEPEEFPFLLVTVKTEDDEDKSSVLHQRSTEENREETHGSSSDTDDSEDYCQQQTPAKRSYAMVPPDSSVVSSDHTPFSRSDCGKRFKSKPHLQSHSYVHSAERPYKCLVCKQGFKQKWYVTKHQRMVHHFCSVCKTCFPNKNKLKEHNGSHVEDGSLDQSSLLCRETVKLYSCSDCGKSFRLKTHLERHMFVHSELRPHKCSLCKKGFNEKTHLNEHLVQGHHFCPVCETCFPCKIKLNGHLRTHVEEGTLDLLFVKPFSCSECWKRFTCNSALQKHMSVHSVEGLQKCSVCTKTFAHSGNMNKPFVPKLGLSWHQAFAHHICPVCFQRSTDRISLSEHLSTHVERGTLDQSSFLFRTIVQSINQTLFVKRFFYRDSTQSALQIKIFSSPPTLPSPKINK